MNASTAARKLNAMRKTFGGAAKVLRPCPLCNHSFGGREMRSHIPKCRKAQARLRKKAA